MKYIVCAVFICACFQAVGGEDSGPMPELCSILQGLPKENEIPEILDYPERKEEVIGSMQNVAKGICEYKPMPRWFWGALGGLVMDNLDIVHDFIFGRSDPPPDPPPGIWCAEELRPTFITDHVKNTKELDFIVLTSEAGNIKAEANPRGSSINKNNDLVENQIRRTTWRSMNGVPEGTYSAGFVSHGRHFESRCTAIRTVKMIDCSWPPGLRDGYMEGSCPNTTLGNKVSYRCNTGFIFNGGDKAVECKGDEDHNGLWLPTPGPCERSKCGVLIPPRNGKMVCTDPDNAYGTICTFSCDTGYMIRAGHKNKAICTQDGTWDTSVPQCVDSVPPALKSCQDDIVQYLGMNQPSVRVFYDIPVYEDNSGEVITPRLVQGQQIGTMFSLGFHTIIFSGEDSAGNAGKRCIFTIDMRAYRCPRIDVKAIDQFLMEPDCTLDNLYGSVCTFKCGHNFELDGEPVTICQRDNNGVASWTNQKWPTCIVPRCPALFSPINGTLNEYEWVHGQLQAPTCARGYDVDRRLDLYACGTGNTEWKPKNPIPNCLRVSEGIPKLLQDIPISVEGGCNDIGSIQSHVTPTIERYVADNCPSGETCRINNLQMECSAKRIFKMRSNSLKIKLDITSGDMQNGDYTENAIQSLEVLDTMDRKLMDGAVGGVLVFPPMNGKAINITKEDMVHADAFVDCQPGKTMAVGETFGCVACGHGTYYDTKEQKCSKCPRGTYQDESEQMSCKTCPTGTSTLEEGSLQLADCLDMCKAGATSSSGIVPCHLCPVGTYQDEIGQNECKACPPGRLTQQEGSKEQTDCQVVDLKLSQDFDNLDFKIVRTNLTSNMNITVTMKANVNEENTPGCALITIRNPRDSNVTFAIGYHDQVLTVHNNGRVISRTVQWSEDMWNLVQAVYVGQDQRITLTLNGDTVLEDSSTSLPFDATVNIVIGNQCSGRITNLQVWNTVEDVNGITDRCYIQYQGNLLSWDSVIRNINISTFTTAPSRCRDSNLCKPNPCLNGGNCSEYNDGSGYYCECPERYLGFSCETKAPFCTEDSCINGGTCVETEDGFTCTCRAEYSGENCEKTKVDGGWGQWSVWSFCSKTCGLGSQERQRLCNNPMPLHGGEDCKGDRSSTRQCTLQECQVCPEIMNPENGTANCEIIGEDKICTLSCDEGFSLNRYVRDNYTCGPDTGHVWTDQIPGTDVFIPPKCTEIQVPEETAITYEVVYPGLSCDPDKQKKQEAAIQEKVNSVVVENIPCVRNGTCEYSIRLEACGSKTSRSKRSPSNSGIAYISVSTRNRGGSYSTAETPENLVNYFVQSVHIEVSRLVIQNKTDGGYMDVVVDGEKLTVDTKESNFNATFNCVGGMRFNSICVACGVGQYKDGNACYPCKRGTYQPNMRQEECLPCPSGMTTNHTESTTVAECYGVSDGNGDHDNLGLKVGLPIGLLAAVVMTTGVVILVRKNKKNKVAPKKEETPDELSMGGLVTKEQKNEVI